MATSFGRMTTGAEFCLRTVDRGGASFFQLELDLGEDTR
jgi:hypothetical protein